MSHFHHVHAVEDEIIFQFARAVGVLPKFFLYAETVEGTITSWDSLVGGTATPVTGSLVVSSTYNGKKAVNVSSNGIVLDTIMGVHQGGQERTVILAFVSEDQAATRTLICSALSSGTADNVVEVSADLNDFGTVKKGTNVTSPATELPQTTPIILAYVSNGTSVKLTCRVGGETTTLLSETIAETVTNHDQMTLFARRISAVVSQEADVHVRLACGFAAALSDATLAQAISMIESPAYFDCPTIEEPEVLFERLMTGPANVFIHSKDLTALVGTNPTSIPNRGTGPAVASVPQPIGYPGITIGYNAVPCVNFDGSGLLDASTSMADAWTLGDSQVILVAFECVNIGNGKELWLQCPNPYTNVFENGELRTTYEFRVYNITSGGAGSQTLQTTNTPMKPGSKYILAYSRDDAGEEILLIRSTTVKGVYSETVLTGTRVVDVLSNIPRFYIGGHVTSATAASTVGPMSLFIAARNVAATDVNHLKDLADLVEDVRGFNLPMGSYANQLLSVPYSSDLQVWYIARLNSVGHQTAIDDLSSLSRDGSLADGATQVLEEFDFNDNSLSVVRPITGTSIPSGTSSLTFMAFVSRRPGAAWSTGSAYTIQGAALTGGTSIVYIFNLRVYHIWNSTVYDTGHSVAGWAESENHIVSYTYDGTTVRSYVDDLTTPIYTFVPGAGRTDARQMAFGRYGVVNGWRHKARAFLLYFNRALSSGELQTAAAACGMNMTHFFFEGDQNVAIDALAPAGVATVWNQLKNAKFPALGYAPAMDLNNAVSRSCWLATNAQAPVSISGRGTALDAVPTTSNINVLVISAGGNDVNLAGMTLTLLQGYIRAYCDARIAAGKWHKIVISEIPPQTVNGTVNAIITAFNAWLPTLISENRVDAVVELPATLQDDTDSDYFFIAPSNNVAPTYNAAGCSEYADALISTLQAMDWA